MFKTLFQDLAVRLSSRKFLLAAGGAITFLANRQYPEAAAVLLAYLGVEGVIDHKNAG